MVKPGYKKTEIGVIPWDWEVVCWEDVLSGFTSGATPYRGNPEYYDGTIKWVTSGELKYNTIFDTIEHISEEAKTKTSLTVHPAGTFLMAITGLEAAGTRGSCALLGTEATTNQSCMAIYGTDKLDIKYLYHYYVSNGDKLAFQYCQGTKQQSYTAAIVKKLPVLLPPFSEQRHISEALSDMDELIASLEKTITKKKSIKQGTMQELLTGKRRLPGFSGEWNTKMFGNLLEICPNNAYTRDQLSVGGKIKNIHYGDILTKYREYLDGSSSSIPTLEKPLEKKKYSEKAFIQDGDIIIADTAEDLTVGKAVEIINVSGKMLSGQHTFLCRPLIPFAPMYLGYYMNSADFHDQIVPFVTGTKVSSINKTALCSLTVRYPDISEQKAIAETLSNMDKAVLALEEKLAKARQIKQGMMQQLLTGNIRI